MPRPFESSKALRQIAKTALFLAGRENDAVFAIAPGPSQKHALFCTRGKDACVIKIEREKADLAHDAAALKRLSKSTIAPKALAYFDPATFVKKAARAKRDSPTPAGGILIMQKAFGRSPQKLSTKNVRAIASTISRLHAQKAPPQFGAMGMRNLRDFLNTLDIFAEESGAFSQKRALLKRIAEESRLLKKTPFAKAKSVLVHGDLRFRNMLVHQDRCTLIDFENACEGDASIDLALFMARQKLDDNACFWLCEAYAQSANDGEVVKRALTLLPLARCAGALGAWRKYEGVCSGALKIFGDKKSWMKEAKRRAEQECERALSQAAPPLPLAARKRAPKRFYFETIAHIEASNMSVDDLELSAKDAEYFLKSPVKIYEKLDGINAIVRREENRLKVYLKPRYEKALNHAVKQSAEAYFALHQRQILSALPEGFSLVFEYLRFTLSTKYTRLPSLAFAICALDKEGVTLPLSYAQKWLGAGALKSNPAIFEGELESFKSIRQMGKRSRLSGRAMEGVIIERQQRRRGPLYAKWVRSDYQHLDLAALSLDALHDVKTNGSSKAKS